MIAVALLLIIVGLCAACGLAGYALGHDDGQAKAYADVDGWHEKRARCER